MSIIIIIIIIIITVVLIAKKYINYYHVNFFGVAILVDIFKFPNDCIHCLFTFSP